MNIFSIHSGSENGIIQDNQENTMGCVARVSATLVLNMPDKLAFVFHVLVFINHVSFEKLIEI